MENKSIEDLVEEYQVNPSDELYNEIFERTNKMGFKKMSKLFKYNNLSEKDVEQLIHMATFKAIKAFDRNKAKFSTWVYYFYKNEVFDYFVESDIIRKPDYVHWRTNRKRIEEIHPEYYQAPVSLDVKVGDDEDNSLLDLIDSETLTPEELVESTYTREWLIKKIMELSPRQSKMILDYFGLIDGRPKTLQELGDKHNLTRERIRQIIAKGLSRLKLRIHKDDID